MQSIRISIRRVNYIYISLNRKKKNKSTYLHFRIYVDFFYFKMNFLTYFDVIALSRQL